MTYQKSRISMKCKSMRSGNDILKLNHFLYEKKPSEGKKLEFFEKAILSPIKNFFVL